MYTKVQIYNIALSALLLQRKLTSTTDENNNEVKVLNQFWDVAFYTTLQDLDLDSLSTKVTLSLISSTLDAPYDELWSFAYTYPSNFAIFRKIHSGYHKDNRATHIPKAVEIYDGQKAILTNEANAVADFIPNNVSLSLLSASAGMAVAHRLAWLSAPLIVGKGAKALRDQITQRYILHKEESQELDRMENFSYYDDAVESEFVYERTT